MAKLYIESGSAEIKVANPISTYGSTGAESLTLDVLASGVVCDQNVEQINLPGLASAYTYQKSGNQLKIYTGTVLFTTVTIQDDTNGTLIRFGDNNIYAITLSGQGMLLGGATVGATASTLIPTATGTPTGTISAPAMSSATPLGKLFLESGDPAISISNPLNIFGSSQNDNVKVNAGILGVSCDQNVDRVDMTGASSAYLYRNLGNQFEIYNGTQLMLTVTIKEDATGTLVGFTDGAYAAKISASGVTLGGSTVSSGSPTSVTGMVSSGTGATTIKVSAGTNYTITQSNASLQGDVPGTSSVSGLSGTTQETVTLTSGVSNISIDQNIEMVVLPGAKSSYTFQQTGGDLKIYPAVTTMIYPATTTLIATVTVQTDGTQLWFSDGLYDATYTSSVMKVGSTTISATTPTVLANQINATSVSIVGISSCEVL